MAGYKQDGWTWEDSGVYLLYPEYGYVPLDLDGENLINYEQEFRMPYLGASADWADGQLHAVGPFDLQSDRVGGRLGRACGPDVELP